MKWRCILGCLGTFANLPPGPVLAKANIGVQLGFSCTHPGPTKAATNCGLLCSSKVMLPRASHRYYLTPEFLPRSRRTKIPSGWLQTTSEQGPVSFTSAISKGRSQQAPDLAVANSASHSQHLHSSSYTVVRSVLIASQPEGQPYAQMGQ